MKRKIIVFILISSMILVFPGCQSEVSVNDSNIKEIVDLAGRKVNVPPNPVRIAAMTGPSYEMVFMLGGHERIAMTKTGHTTNYPLALLTNPNLANYEGIGANPSSSVNIEDYLSREIDLVIYYNNDNELKKFADVGIPAIVLTLNTIPVTSLEEMKSRPLEEYIDEKTFAVKALAEVLGEDSIRKAETWEEYCTEKLNMLYERTHNLSDEQRKTVYWGNTWGENILASYTLANHSYSIWLCGGKLLGPEIGTGNFPEITKEQLFDWDPDVILVDNHGNYPELVIESMYKEGSLWSDLKAVQNNDLHRIPAGVFFMDKGTTSTLMLLWASTIIQPELFSDIDMVEEIKYYYEEFYEFELTDEEALKVINGWYERIGDE